MLDGAHYQSIHAVIIKNEIEKNEREIKENISAKKKKRKNNGKKKKKKEEVRLLREISAHRVQINLPYMALSTVK